MRKEQYDTALTEPFRYEHLVSHTERNRSEILGILSAEEMNVSITTWAPLKKSPNYRKEDEVRDRNCY